MLTALILIGIALTAGFGIAAYRRVSPSRALPAAGPRDPDLFTLEVGDVVQHVDVDYIVDGKLVYSQADGSTWTEYLLSSGSGTADRWLSVEEDDRVHVALVDHIDHVAELSSSTRPSRFTHEGVAYRLAEHGEATATRVGRTGKKQELRCRFWDYEAEAGDGVLSVEEWGSEVEVCVGRTIPPSSLTCLPGGDDGQKLLSGG